MSGILLQNGKQAFTDANGHPLAGGRVFFYAPNTNTPKDTWQDAAQTILNTNPIILDARGEASIYGSGSYRQVLKDASLVQIWDAYLPDLAGSLQGAINDLYSRAAIQVPNVAAVRALDKTIYKNAQTLGYYAAGDDGSAQYYLDPADTTSADNGGSILVGADGGRWKFLTPFEGNIRQFGAKGDNSTDDTAAIQKAIDWVTAFGGYQTIVGAITGGYISQTVELGAPKGKYKLTKAINCGSYLKFIGDNAFFIQSDSNEDILSGVNEAYQWEIRGINFVGGRHHLKMQNANIDVTRWRISECTFSLSSDFAIKTFPTGGANSHLSANLTIKQCAFYKPRRVLLNYCDSAIVEDCWVLVSKENYTPSTPVFENGSISCDGHPNLYLNNMFGVPVMGTFGVDRITAPRWVDVFKGSLVARGSRFGGEFAGMPIVYWLAPPVITYPFRGNTVSLVDCECFAGPGAANDSAIVSLQGQVPQRISVVNCAGPIEVPYVINAGGQIANFAAYFANYAATSGQAAYTQFRFNFMMNDSLNPDGAVYAARIPLGMRVYSQNLRATKVTRTASQGLTTGNNIVAFDTLNYDSQGGWAAANGNRLVLPMGASKMLIICDVIMNGSFNGGVLDLQIQNSSSQVVVKQNFLLPANTDGPAMSISHIVDGNPGDWFQINMRTTATTPGSIISAVATTQSLDYIG
jgi:hypothetical protein